MKHILSVFLLFAICQFGIGQGVEDEIDFKYVKAKYLLDTERYEDAIRALTEIIKLDPTYNDALVLRGEAKYELGAYKGTKQDILLSVETTGITEKGLVLLGKSSYKLNETAAAFNTLQTASKLNVEDARAYEFLGDLYQEDGQLLKACEAWEKAAGLGSSKAGINLKKKCGSTKPTKSTKSNSDVTSKTKSKIDRPSFPSSKTKSQNEDEVIKDKTSTPTETSEDSNEKEDDSLNNPTKGSVLDQDEKDPINEPNDEGMDDIPEEEFQSEDDDLPAEDNTPNDIEIDEDLSLTIYGQGLGKRKVLNQPNILILSDVDGIVAIDICVNKRGKVESAQFNKGESSIVKKSLISLAIRKSKDFWFEKNDYKEQCGVILFNIKGN